MKRFCLLFILMCSTAAMGAEVIPPRPQGNYINDYAHVLGGSTVTELNKKLGDFERESSNQVLF